MPNAHDRLKTSESDELSPSFDFSRNTETHTHVHEAKIQLADVNNAFKMILDACRAEDGIDKKAVESLTSGYCEMISRAAEAQTTIHSSIHANKRDTRRAENEQEIALLNAKHKNNMALIQTLGLAASGVISTLSEVNSLRQENNELIEKIEKLEKQRGKQKDNSPTAPKTKFNAAK